MIALFCGGPLDEQVESVSNDCRTGSTVQVAVAPRIMYASASPIDVETTIEYVVYTCVEWWYDNEDDMIYGRFETPATARDLVAADRPTARDLAMARERESIRVMSEWFGLSLVRPDNHVRLTYE